MISMGTPVAFVAVVFLILNPAVVAQDEKIGALPDRPVIAALSSPEVVARLLGGDGALMPSIDFLTNVRQPMVPAASSRHSMMIFFAAVGAGALFGALIDGGDGAGKGALLGGAAGVGYLIAVHF